MESAVLGQNMRRWLSHPGEDFPVILALLQRHGSVQGVPLPAGGELGSVTEVEISAVGDRAPNAKHIGLLIRDVTSRGAARRAAPARLISASLRSAISRRANSLETVVQAAVEAIERRYIEEALAKFRGNRTLAARRLGLSRQTLHVKLNKYKLDLG